MFLQCLLSSRARYIGYINSYQAFPPRSSFPSPPSPYLLLSITHHTAPSSWCLTKWHQLTISSNLRVSKISTSSLLPLDCPIGHRNLLILPNNNLSTLLLLCGFVQVLITWLLNSEPNSWLLDLKILPISSSTLLLPWIFLKYGVCMEPDAQRLRKLPQVIQPLRNLGSRWISSSYTHPWSLTKTHILGPSLQLKDTASFPDG